MSYNYDTFKYHPKNLKDEYDTGLIDTSMDYQRGYIWVENQQQLMFNSLITDAPISGLHINIRNKPDGTISRRVLDGKQRLTTIFKILNNEIHWKITYAPKEYHKYFNNKKKICFSDLPIELQNEILYKKDISINEYKNLTDIEEIGLFKILNNGTQLKGFQRILSGAPKVRTDYLTPIIEHPVIFYSASERALQNSKAEKQVACLYAILYPYYKYGDLNIDTISFEDPILKNSEIFIPIEKSQDSVFINSWELYMNQVKNNIIFYLNVLKINNIYLNTKNFGQLVFPFVYAAIDELNDEEFVNLVIKTNELNSQIVGSSSTFNNKTIKTWMNYIEENILPYLNN